MRYHSLLLALVVSIKINDIDEINDRNPEPYEPLPPDISANLNDTVIINNCDYDVYLWSVDKNYNQQSPTKASAHTAYSEKYRTP